jgi:hypothetical protein
MVTGSPAKPTMPFRPRRPRRQFGGIGDHGGKRQCVQPGARGVGDGNDLRPQLACLGHERRHRRTAGGQTDDVIAVALGAYDVDRLDSDGAGRAGDGHQHGGRAQPNGGMWRAMEPNAC